MPDMSNRRGIADLKSADGGTSKATYDVFMGTALVTGATSGLGLEFCWQLASEMNDLVMVARDIERLEATAEEVRQTAGVKVEVLQADLADPDDLARVCNRLAVAGPLPSSKTAGGRAFLPLSDSDHATDSTEDGLRAGRGESSALAPITLLVNNAGFGLGKPFLDDSLDHQEFGLDVMVRAVMATSHAAGNAMRARGRGAIINVSSVAADSGMGTYSAHKAWVRSFTQGLAEELRGTGVTVTVTQPGLVRTEFHQRSDMDLSGTPDFIWCDAETVVEQTLDAARRGKVIEVPTARYKFVNTIQRHVPDRLVRMLTRLTPHQ